MIKPLILTLGLAAVMLPLAASADEVSARGGFEVRQIDRAVNDGRITPAHGHRLVVELEHVNAERRRDEFFGGGHLTPWQYHRLNDQEANIARQAHFDSYADRF